MSRRDELVGRAIELGWRLAPAVPAGVADRVAHAAADVMLRSAGTPVRQLARNLGRVLAAAGPLDRDVFTATLRAALRSYARYWVETVRLPALDLDAVLDTALADTFGLEHIAEPLRAGRGVVLAVPHSGNWDVAGLIVGRLFGGLATVAERVRPESLFQRFVAHRSALGMQVLPLTGGDVPATAVLTERLRAGGVVCLPADRDLTGTGIEVDFFGGRTTMPPGPAMLAARTGADLCTVEINYGLHGEPGRWHNVVSPPIPLTGGRLRETVATATQAVADAFAADIARAPHDWHLMQPVWLDDPAHRGARRATGQEGRR